MLCEISESVFGGGTFSSFVLTWLAMSVIGFVSLMSTSTVAFLYYYGYPTYDKWLTKINPQYPTPEKVRDEILQTVKGMCTATLVPAMSLYLSANGYSHAYCGLDRHPVWYSVAQFLLIVLASDFLEFYYHRMGHVFPGFWQHHREHHVFFNPSPFSVIADGHVDQFCRATPLMLFPMVMPINMDILFFTYAVFFYVYGIYLHFGHEFEWLDAHHPILNTSFQHYCHHAKSVLGTPYHTGFFIKAWDQMFGSVYDKECFCTKCARKTWQRSPEMFAKIHKPQYSVLLNPQFWLGGVSVPTNGRVGGAPQNSSQSIKSKVTAAKPKAS